MATMEQPPGASGSGSLPLLSPTIQATQLLTPRQMDRFTIDQSHYHDHLRNSIATTQPSEKNAVQRRVTRMGDNYFFLQKDLPVEQSYARTALQLCPVRPWDQILERPLKSANVVQKEIHLPFPQEHPYTSHISRFTIFPDTASNNMVNAQTQTGNPPLIYEVSHKAGDSDRRVECRHLRTPGDLNLTSGAGTMLWDLPRSQRHKRAYTYPAPSQQYSRPLTAPQYLPLPSTIKPSLANQYNTPASQMALRRIHQVLTRTTTYSEQFSPPNTPTGLPNILKTAYTFRSRDSHRPWTAESRGKYNRVSVSAQESSLGTSRLQTATDDSSSNQEVENNESTSLDVEIEQDTKEKKPIMADACTQTEEGRTEFPSLFTDHQVRDRNESVRTTVDPGLNISQRSNLNTPRTAQSTQRLMSLFNGFNKTDICKRFHEEFPEKAPDLREYGLQNGKRHTIHGSHAYYFH